ncbi:MAG: GIY-YIG nuclease family protein [Planctomycetota bacterium]|nr:GIY-YIG nuclease family protein [Planctomycetota bacterium]
MTYGQLGTEQSEVHMWYVYMLRLKRGKIYTGMTTNLEKRIKSHQGGHGCGYTKAFKVECLIYSEPHDTKDMAAKRERYIKGLSRVKKEKIVAGFLRP